MKRVRLKSRWGLICLIGFGLVLTIVRYDSSIESDIERAKGSTTWSRQLSKCQKFPEPLVKSGYMVSKCNGRLGNQLGLMSFGLAMNLKFGLKLGLKDYQYRILAAVFDLEEACGPNKSTSFCVRLPHNCK